MSWQDLGEVEEGVELLEESAEQGDQEGRGGHQGGEVEGEGGEGEDEPGEEEEEDGWQGACEEVGQHQPRGEPALDGDARQRHQVEAGQCAGGDGEHLDHDVELVLQLHLHPLHLPHHLLLEDITEQVEPIGDQPRNRSLHQESPAGAKDTDGDEGGEAEHQLLVQVLHLPRSDLDCGDSKQSDRLGVKKAATGVFLVCKIPTLLGWRAAALVLVTLALGL